MPQQAKKPRGGIKLRRCISKANQYATQFHRTERNKLKAKERIQRRKLEKPKGYKARRCANLGPPDQPQTVV